MLASLSKGKKYLSDLFEQSTLAYDQRDECCGKLRSMQEKGKVDQMMQMQVRNSLSIYYSVQQLELLRFAILKKIDPFTYGTLKTYEKQKKSLLIMFRGLRLFLK